MQVHIRIIGAAGQTNAKTFNSKPKILYRVLHKGLLVDLAIEKLHPMKSANTRMPDCFPHEVCDQQD